MLKILFFSLCMLSLGLFAEDHGHEEHDDHDEKASDGFKLSAMAIKNFELSYVDYKLPATTISTKAILKSLSEMNIYRLRGGLYKRINFKTLEKGKGTMKVNSPDLLMGDKIVVSGIGFLRIAEIAASGGLSDSHSH